MKKINYFKYVFIAILIVLVIFLGGITYAHINGVETFISPLLRSLGINSRYEESTSTKQYEHSDYRFIYNDTWKLTEKIDTNKVGPNSIYLGALELEISPSASIYVKVTEQNSTLVEYAKQIRNENTKSPSEYYEEVLSSEMNFKNSNGYQIVASISDGETNYIKQDIFTVNNGKVYRITFFGREIDYNNLKGDIKKFINDFEVK